MKTPEQYIEDMKYISSGVVFWEPVHMANVMRQALEAQHRKTWALAIATLSAKARYIAHENQEADYYSDRLTNTPCPPMNKPSEKAMQLAGDIMSHALNWSKDHAAALIDAHTAARVQLLAKALEGACNTLEANGIGAAVGREALAEAGITQEKVG